MILYPATQAIPLGAKNYVYIMAKTYALALVCAGCHRTFRVLKLWNLLISNSEEGRSGFGCNATTRLKNKVVFCLTAA